MVTRRQLLLGAGVGVAGLAVGAGGTALGFEQFGLGAGGRSGQATANRMAQMAEDAGGAGPYGLPGRLGARQVVWSTQPMARTAAISFDDGPTPEFTPRILQALADAHVQATFFVMGYNAARHPDLIRALLAAGHEIGNHTWTHLDQTTIGPRQIREEIVRCKDEVEKLTKQPLMGFRPPRGELTGYATKVCGELGYDVFMWSLTRGPSGTSTPEAVQKYVSETIQPGDILDLHDGIGRGTFSPLSPGSRDLAARREVEVRALPATLKRIAERGITITSVGRLVAASAVTVHTPVAQPGRPAPVR